MRPSELLDAKRDLVERMAGSPDFGLYFAKCVDLGFTLTGDMKRNGGLGREIIKRVPFTLSAAENYLVTEDMCSMVYAAAAGLDESDLFERDLAPSPWGFVRFERPLPLQDVRGETMLIHFMHWFQSTTGTVFLTMNDLYTEPDEVYLTWKATSQGRRDWEKMSRDMGRWAFDGLDHIKNGESLGPPTLAADEEAQRIMLEKDPDAFEKGFHEWTNVHRYGHALWLILAQQITTVEDATIERAAGKRAIRAKQIPTVSVITLRRGKTVPQSHRKVDWSCSWPVVGHWRWQHLGPRAADHEHDYGKPEVVKGCIVKPCKAMGCEHFLARTWIHEYVKGPADKPLRAPDKVHLLRR